MKHICLPTAALLLSSTAAFAQLTPQDVLESWRGFYAGFGATISTSAPVVTGNTTRFANVFSRIDMAGSEARYNFEWVDMRSNADGSVDIRFSPIGYATTFFEIEGRTLESRTSYDLGALTIHAEGVPEDIRFSYDAPIITAHQSQTMPDGAELALTVAMVNFLGSARSSQMEGLISDSGNMNIDSFTAKLSVQAPSDIPVYVDYSAENFSVDYDISMPLRAIPEQAETMDFFQDNMVFGMSLSAGTATTVLDQQTSEGKGKFTFSHSGSEITAAFAENALSYGYTATDATLGLANTPPQPVDFTAAFQRFHFGMTLPMKKSDTPAPFALALALEGLTVDDAIWDKLDPEATLSRAPASFAFALNGTAKLFADLFDQTALTALRGAPFELRSLSLQSLSLDIEGMGLTGAGDVAFNNERIDPMSGLPEPLGVLDFSVTGALGMLDKIGRLGLVDPMVIIGAKGALGMFASPTEAADSFTSRIEFTEGGGVSVNGQPVR